MTFQGLQIFPYNLIPFFRHFKYNKYYHYMSYDRICFFLYLVIVAVVD